MSMDVTEVVETKVVTHAYVDEDGGRLLLTMHN